MIRAKSKSLCCLAFVLTMALVLMPLSAVRPVAAELSGNVFGHTHDPRQLDMLREQIEARARAGSDYSVVIAAAPSKTFLYDHNPHGYPYEYYNIALIKGDGGKRDVESEHTLFYAFSANRNIHELYIHSRYESEACPSPYDNRDLFAFFADFMSMAREYFGIPESLEFNNPRIVYEDGELIYETADRGCGFLETIRFIGREPALPEGPQVYLDGKIVRFDVPPVFVNGTTLVPMRKLLEELGAEVTWHAETNTVIGTLEDRTITYQIGATEAEVNGQTVELRVPGFAKDGRTLIPLRFFSEALGFVVGWEGRLQSITISSVGLIPAVVSGHDASAGTIQVTYKADDGTEREEQVRLIGVGAGPDADGFGEDALAYLLAKAPAGSRVTIETDDERRDRDGSLWGYVYLSDGTQLNAALLAEGWARLLTIVPNVRWTDLYATLARHARDLRLGLWSDAKQP